MMSPEWLEAADTLAARAFGPRAADLAVMCAETLWWRCHRSLIADYFVWRGLEVVHLQPELNRHSQVIGDRLSRYPPEVIVAWGDWHAGPPRL